MHIFINPITKHLNIGYLKLQIALATRRQISPGAQMYSIANTSKNTVLKSSNLLRD